MADAVVTFVDVFEARMYKYAGTLHLNLRSDAPAAGVTPLADVDLCLNAADVPAFPVGKRFKLTLTPVNE